MNNQKGKKVMKILLAIDGSEHSKTTIDEIAGRPFPPNTKVRIITAYQTTPLITTLEPMGVSKDYYVETNLLVLKATKEIIEKAAKILRKKNPSLTVTTIAMEGSPKSVILDEAEKFGANLIVVGSHGQGGVERFLLGSVAYAVSFHAKCSVEIVRK